MHTSTSTYTHARAIHSNAEETSTLGSSAQLSIKSLHVIHWLPEKSTRRAKHVVVRLLLPKKITNNCVMCAHSFIFRCPFEASDGS